MKPHKLDAAAEKDRKKRKMVTWSQVPGHTKCMCECGGMTNTIAAATQIVSPSIVRALRDQSAGDFIFNFPPNKKGQIKVTYENSMSTGIWPPVVRNAGCGRQL